MNSDQLQLYEIICNDSKPLVNKKHLADIFIEMDKFMYHKDHNLSQILAMIAFTEGEKNEKVSKGSLAKMKHYINKIIKREK